MFLPDTYEQKLLIIDAGEKGSIFYNKIERAKHGRIPDEKRKFQKTKDFFSMVQKKFLMLSKVICF